MAVVVSLQSPKVQEEEEEGERNQLQARKTHIINHHTIDYFNIGINTEAESRRERRRDDRKHYKYNSYYHGGTTQR
jgi:hypothetical protein